MKTNRKSCLDEMQNQKLLKLEEYGFWMMFWASLSVILGQLFLGGSFKEIAGEMLILLIGSLLMISLGIIGYYLAQIYQELKGRPRYLISEVISGGSGKKE